MPRWASGQAGDPTTSALPSSFLGFSLSSLLCSHLPLSLGDQAFLQRAPPGGSSLFCAFQTVGRPLPLSGSHIGGGVGKAPKALSKLPARSGQSWNTQTHTSGGRADPPLLSLPCFRVHERPHPPQPGGKIREGFRGSAMACPREPRPGKVVAGGVRCALPR